MTDRSPRPAVLVTRPRSQSGAFAAALAEAGFAPVFFPVIEIRPLDDTARLDTALRALGSYDWLVFTSANGVEVVLERLQALGLPIPGMAGPRLAAIGPRTAAALDARGMDVHLVPDEYVAEAILPGLGDLAGRRVLLPRAEIARKALPEAIRAAGGTADEIAVYQTLPAAVEPAGLDALCRGVEWVTFTSPSTVHNFIIIARQAGLDPLALPGSPKIACIGPITGQAAREQGFEVSVIARQYTADGLVDAIRPFLPENPG